MKLSEAIIEAMNDIDESFLMGSEMVEKKGYILSRKNWLILTSFALCLAIALPLMSKYLFSTNNMSSPSYMNEDAYIEEEYENAKAEESYDASYAIVSYADDLLEEANNNLGQIIIVEIRGETNGHLLTKDEYEMLAEDFSKQGYVIKEVTEEYILMEVLGKDIKDMNIYSDYGFDIYIDKNE